MLRVQRGPGNSMTCWMMTIGSTVVIPWLNCVDLLHRSEILANCDQTFDVVSLEHYDTIVGTPFLYQHQVTIGFNPSCVTIGLSEPLGMICPEVMTISSAATDLLNKGTDNLKDQLRHETEDLCQDTSKTVLPSNHLFHQRIPLVPDSVSMPANMLEAIHTTGNTSCPTPTPTLHPSIPSCSPPRHHASPPPTNKVRGGNGNEGRGLSRKGRQRQSKGKASISQAPNQVSSLIPAPIAAVPVPVTVIPDPILPHRGSRSKPPQRVLDITYLYTVDNLGVWTRGGL